MTFILAFILSTVVGDGEYTEQKARLFSESIHNLTSPGQPAFLTNGNLAVGSLKGPLFFFDSAGHRLADIEGNNSSLSQPAELPEFGIVAASAYRKSVYFFSPKGGLIATYESENEIFTASPTIVDRQTVLEGSWQGKLSLIQVNATKKTVNKLADLNLKNRFYYPGVPLGKDRFLFGSDFGALILVEAKNGNLKKLDSTELYSGIIGPPVILKDGSIGVFTEKGMVYLLDTNLQVKASADLGEGPSKGLSFGYQPFPIGIRKGNLLAVPAENSIRILDLNLKETARIPLHRVLGPAELKDENLVAATYDQDRVHIYDLNFQETSSFKTESGVHGSPVVAPDGTTIAVPLEYDVGIYKPAK